ncbi:MAG: phytanoyl-CoA dioxygenase family protein [Caldilineaceae bacterium]|nr:phytanoyl-CoA dioxygenase family protein [Caldilineaceae bacterium]
MFTTSEREIFAVHGLFKRKNFLAPEKLAKARQVIFQQLEQEGIWCHGGWCLDNYPHSTELAAGMALLKPLWDHSAIVDLLSDEVPTAASALVDNQPVLTMGQQLLFTLPNATAWTLPHQNWHMDMPRLAHSGVPGVQLFAFLESVEPGGGGTLAVTGSHRLLNQGVRISSGDLRKKLKKERYFAELMSNTGGDRRHFLHDAGQVGDVKLQVVEMVGEPGDVYFMDLRTFHTAAPNARPIPRLMLTQRYLLGWAYRALYNK